MLTVQDIQDRVLEVENDRGDWKARAEDWETAYRLDPFVKNARDAAKAEGKDLVVLPTPRNVFGLAERLINDVPRIDVPPVKMTRQGERQAEKIEKWLNAIWRQMARMERGSLVLDAWSMVLLRGKCVFEAKWVEQALPKRLREHKLPFVVRVVDPLECGFRNGPLYTEFAYHKWEQSKDLIRQKYPDAKFRETNFSPREGFDSDKCEVLDFWWIDPKDGATWNAVLVDDEFVIKPKEAQGYNDLPYVEFQGYSLPIEDEFLRGQSIIEPFMALWQYECNIASQIASGLRWYFEPFMVHKSETGESLGVKRLTHGEIQTIGAGDTIELIRVEPNVPLAQQMMAIVEKSTQQASFPDVMYGQAPGDLQAGYGVSLLTNSARGHINKPRQHVERAVEYVNGLILGMVENFAGKGGVEVWDKDERAGDMYRVTLTPKDIDGYYENMVSIDTTLPQDQMQLAVMGLQMVQAGAISLRTYRDKFLHIDVPSDEEDRIQFETAQKDQTIAQRLAFLSMAQYWGQAESDEGISVLWTMVRGTPYEPMYLEYMVSMMYPGEDPTQFHFMPDGKIMRNEVMQMGPPLPGSNQGFAEPPMGPPPGMGAPPLGPEMGGPPMPPPGMESQAGPPMMPEGGPGLNLQPPSVMPQGMPPNVQGQLMPEDLDMLRRENPLLFQTIMRGRRPPGETQDLLLGAPGNPPVM